MKIMQVLFTIIGIIVFIWIAYINLKIDIFILKKIWLPLLILMVVGCILGLIKSKKDDTRRTGKKGKVAASTDALKNTLPDTIHAEEGQPVYSSQSAEGIKVGPDNAAEPQKNTSEENKTGPAFSAKNDKGVAFRTNILFVVLIAVVIFFIYGTYMRNKSERNLDYIKEELTKYQTQNTVQVQVQPQQERRGYELIEQTTGGSGTRYVNQNPSFSIILPGGFELTETMNKSGIIVKEAGNDHFHIQITVADIYTLSNYRNINRDKFSYNAYTDGAMKAAFDGYVKSFQSEMLQIVKMDNFKASIKKLGKNIFIYSQFDYIDSAGINLQRGQNAFFNNGYTIHIITDAEKNYNSPKEIIDFLNSFSY
jgi:hypothetical protein